MRSRSASPKRMPVQDQNERPVKHCSKVRIEISAKRQQIENVLSRKKIGYKLGLRRQMRPDRFNNLDWSGRPPQITEELPQDPCIVGNTDCFTAWFTRQPTDRSL